MNNILLVEDKAEYAAAAKEVFGTQISTHAQNLEQANQCITTQRPAYIITDCFFPKDNTDDYSLGLQIRDQLYTIDRSKEFLEAIEPYVEREDKFDAQMRDFARQKNIGTDGPLVKVIRLLSKDGEFKEGVSAFLQSRDYMGDASKDWYYQMTLAMQQDSANQPLGIRVAELAEEQHIPYVFATSTYHHDLLTQPIQNYIGAKKLSRMIDCTDSDEKSQTPFWERVKTHIEKE